MHEVSFEEALVKIAAKDPRYHRDAYLFVREALDHTQKTIGKDPRGRIRHVTGQELLAGIREFALQQFGPMTKTVLEEWGIRCSQDFGEIVFNMVEVGWLAKTEKDSRADFRAWLRLRRGVPQTLPARRASKPSRRLRPSPRSRRRPNLSRSDGMPLKPIQRGPHPRHPAGGQADHARQRPDHHRARRPQRAGGLGPGLVHGGQRSRRANGWARACRTCSSTCSSKAPPPAPAAGLTRKSRRRAAT